MLFWVGSVAIIIDMGYEIIDMVDRNLSGVKKVVMAREGVYTYGFFNR